MTFRLLVTVLVLGSRAASAQFGPEAAAQLDPRRLEVGGLPAVTYDTDSGLGVGALLNLVQLAPDQLPYVWRLEAYASVTIKVAPDGTVQTPFHQDYVNLEVPDLWGSRLRANVMLVFERESNSPYYGAGNASVRDLGRLALDRHAYEADRIGPALRGSLRARLATRPEGRLDAFAGLTTGWTWVNVYAGSTLADDLRLLPPGERPHGTGSHGSGTLSLGLLWDGRDQESVPTRGVLSELSVRAGAGVLNPFAFAGLNLDERVFVPLWAPYVVLAMRFTADLLFGEPPFYELVRNGGLNPFGSGGGARSLRGVPNGRYAGKVKLLGNLELRVQALDVVVLKQRFRLGAVGFADVGRFFAGYTADPERDGYGPGLKAGVGGGLRLRWGEHFVLRLDFAVSPTERTQGLYLGVRHNF